MRNAQLPKRWQRVLLSSLLCFYSSFALAGESSLPSLKQKTKQQESLQLKTLFACLYDFAAAVQGGKPEPEKQLAACQKIFTKIRVKILPEQGQTLDIAFLALHEKIKPGKNNGLLTSAEKTQTLTALDAVLAGLLEFYQIKTSPALTVDPDFAQKLYRHHCASCHGLQGRGDGLLAAKLPSKPTAFTGEDFAAISSPFMTFNTVLLGKKQSAMPAYGDLLTVEDLWALSFFVQGFYWQAEPRAAQWAKESLSLDKNPRIKNMLDQTKISYSLLARSRDAELAALLKDTPSDPSLFLYWLRVVAPYGKELARVQKKTP